MPVLKPSKMLRYEQFRDIIAKHKPQTIVEVGTHIGRRAWTMISFALDFVPEVTYTGYDIFEQIDHEAQAEALNQKGYPTEAKARVRFRKLSEQYGSRLRWRLIKGDTRKTLAGQHVVADLAFIDGDHRVVTIRSDYNALKGSGCVVFDDYLSEGPSGKLPNLTVYGANEVVDSIPDAQVLPVKDLAAGGWYVQLAMVIRNG